MDAEKKETIIEAIALLNTAKYDTESLNYKRDEVVSDLKKQLSIHAVMQAQPEKVCEQVRETFDEWVFGVETQAGEKLKVVDSTDFNDIITEIENKLKVK